MLFSILFPLLLGAVGLFLLIKLRFFFIVHPIRTAKEIVDEMKRREVRRSFFLALAGTLGVGNIFGVAAGIQLGGSGVLFWIFISSFFSMVIKYAETLLVIDTASEKPGMSGVISRVFNKNGSTLSVFYAILTVGLALFMGGAIQSAAFTDVSTEFLENKLISGILLTLSVLIPVAFVGSTKIDKITEIIIPLTTIIYIIMCFAVVIINFRNIPSVISDIVSSALNLKSCGGFLCFLAIKEGFARGILSNEAGVGTSALAHSTVRDRTPHSAGLFGICEVFFDTTILCTLTGLAVLLSVKSVSDFKTPMQLVSGAFVSSLGAFSEVLLIFCIFFFSYATIICWYNYGFRCTDAYFPRLTPIFSILFFASVAFASFLNHRLLLSITDVFLFLMALMTLSGIIKRRHRIISASSEKCNKTVPRI